MKRQPNDYQAFLNEVGVTQEQMDAALLAMPVPIDIASDPRHRVLPSATEGLGVFSCGYFNAGGRVCTLKVGGAWTVSGRYINHDPEPNLKAIVDGNGLTGLAAREVSEGDELTLDYRQVRDALA